MKNVIVLIIISFSIFACSKASKIDFDLNTLPKDWIELTKTDSGLVVYNSCDAGNSIISIKKKEKNIEILMHGRQEDYLFSVLKSYRINDTVVVEAKWKDTEKIEVFKFLWINKEKMLGKWYLFNKEETTFIAYEKQSNYPHIEQPCIECWGEECNEIKRIDSTQVSCLLKIKRIFEEFTKNNESVDSEENKDLIKKCLKKIITVNNPNDFELLINVWMYYDPTDFSCRDDIYKILKQNLFEGTKAVERRIKNKKEWENKNSAPYSELQDLLTKLKNE